MTLDAKNAQEPVPDLAHVLRMSEFVFEVPQSVYGAAVMGPILRESTGHAEVWQFQMVPWIWLLLSNFLQILFVRGIYYITLENAESSLDLSTCEELDITILLSALCVFIVVLLRDLQETVDMAELFLRQVPTRQRTSVLKFKSVGDGLELVGGGMSLIRKFFVLVLVILPKLAIAASILCFGLTYLAFSATNSDVILNCTGLCFVIEVDELLYNFFSTPRIRRLVEACPPFTVNDRKSGKLWFFLRPYGPYVKLLATILLSSISLITISRCGFEASTGLGIHEGHMTQKFSQSRNQTMQGNGTIQGTPPPPW